MFSEVRGGTLDSKIIKVKLHIVKLPWKFLKQPRKYSTLYTVLYLHDTY